MARKSIHMTEATESYIKARATAESLNLSGATNAAFDVLRHLAAAEKPELTADEWTEIYNVYAGSDLLRPVLPFNLAADLLMYYGATIPQQLPESAQPLVVKLAGLSQAQQFAVIDAVRLFWASDDAEE